MSFSEMGFEGADLSGVEVRSGQSILGAGRHVVNINSAEVEKDEKKKTIQLVLGYENDDGVIRQWIYKYHDGSEAATRIGLEQIVSLLTCIGHDAKKTPHPSFFMGKKVGIVAKDEVYNGKTSTKVKYHFTVPEDTESKKAGDIGDEEIPF